MSRGMETMWKIIHRQGVRNLIFCSGKGGGVASRSRWRGLTLAWSPRRRWRRRSCRRPRRREEDVGAVLDGASLVPERRSLALHAARAFCPPPQRRVVVATLRAAESPGLANLAGVRRVGGGGGVGTGRVRAVLASCLESALTLRRGGLTQASPPRPPRFFMLFDAYAELTLRDECLGAGTSELAMFAICVGLSVVLIAWSSSRIDGRESRSPVYASL